MIGVGTSVTRAGARAGRGTEPLEIYTSWINDGVWQDGVPTGTPTWSSPVGRGSAFTVWDDAQETT